MALGAQTLPLSQIRPLFRALTHQTHITAVLISDNGLGDNGVKYLTECLCTMKHLTQLDISKNNIGEEGTQNILNLFEKATRPVCQLLDYLNISSNPIGDVGFKNIIKLGQYIRLKTLKVSDCKITNNAFNKLNKPTMNFDNLECFDISNNYLKQNILSSIVSALNPNLLTELELEEVGVEGNIAAFLATFLDSAKQLKIRRFNLSNCTMQDGQFMKILR